MDYNYSRTQKTTTKQKLESVLQSQTFKHQNNAKTSDATNAEYMRKLQLLAKSKQMPFDYCSERNLSKKTHNTIVAAVKKRWCRIINDALNSNDKEQIKTTLDAAKKIISELVKEYKQQQNSTQERRLRESGKISKRKTLRGLPDDWRKQVQVQLENSKYRDAAMILHLSGCRPAELTKGVELKAENGFLSMYIVGSKQSEINKSGQELRRISYAENSSEGRQLAALLAKSSMVKIESAQSFQKIYKAAATKALGKPGKRITPYAARHQFSADLKKNGFDKVEIAAAMGHQSTRSQGQYGTGNQGRGGCGMSAQASQKIRDPERAPMQSQDHGMRM